MPYCYALAEHGTTLATRPFGKELRTDLIGRGIESDLVVLDFSDVLSVSHSFADEFVAALVEEANSGAVRFKVALSGAGSDVEGVVLRAIERRGVQLASAA